MALKYTGGGYGGFLPQVPARDISDEELKANHYRKEDLLASGLYEEVGSGKSEVTKVKAALGGSENKSEKEK